MVFIVRSRGIRSYILSYLIVSDLSADIIEALLTLGGPAFYATRCHLVYSEMGTFGLLEVVVGFAEATNSVARLG